MLSLLSSHVQRRNIESKVLSKVTLFVVPHLLRDYFIPRVPKETDDDGIKNYITNRGVQDFSLSLGSNVNAMFKSYKLSISISEFNKVLCAEMWPSGVCMCKGGEGEILIGMMMKDN